MTRRDGRVIATLGYALLGVLARGPRSGYEVAQLMRAPGGFIWHARHSQIYPELAALEAQGLVTFEVVEQTDRPAKKVYSVTETGLAALRKWVTSPLDVPAVRDELMLRAYCVWMADPTRARALFRERAEQHESQLAVYESLRAAIRDGSADSEPGTGSPEFGTYAALMRGISSERESAAWCRWMADRLQADAGSAESR